MSEAGLLLFILGVAGMGGATETGKGLGLSIAFFIVGALLIYTGERGGHAKDKNKSNHTRSGGNCHNYPAGLANIKRGA